MRMFSPWVLLGVVLAVGGAYAKGSFDGAKRKANEVAAEQLEQETVEQRMQKALAAELAKVKVVNKTIQETIEVRTREVPVYRDCQHTDDVFRLLNDIIAGRAAPDAISNSVVPATDASAG